jgi:hypothetical protein
MKGKNSKEKRRWWSNTFKKANLDGKRGIIWIFAFFLSKENIINECKTYQTTDNNNKNKKNKTSHCSH